MVVNSFERDARKRQERTVEEQIEKEYQGINEGKIYLNYLF
jgi:hypothetical protein